MHLEGQRAHFLSFPRWGFIVITQHTILEVEMSNWGLGVQLLEPGTWKRGVVAAGTTPKPFVSLGPERPR